MMKTIAIAPEANSAVSRVIAAAKGEVKCRCVLGAGLSQLSPVMILVENDSSRV